MTPDKSEVARVSSREGPEDRHDRVAQHREE